MGTVNEANATTDISADAKERLRAAIRECGVTLCGFTAPEIPHTEVDRLRQWLASGYGAEMDWLARTAEDRANPSRRFPWARTAVCLGLAYDRPEPRSGEVLPRISRYAQGRDYHNVLRSRLRAAMGGLQEFGATQNRAYADTGPVMERVLAERAGLGWRGKNTLVLNRTWGSMLFLAVIFTDLPVPPDTPETDHCGNCTKCLDACPTDAFPAPGVLDSRRCISYLNIEHRSDYEAPYDASLEGWLHGCDVCQEVCPFVSRARRDQRWGDPDFAPRETWGEWQLIQLADIDEPRWDALTRGSPVRRGGPDRLRRVANRLLAGRDWRGAQEALE